MPRFTQKLSIRTKITFIIITVSLVAIIVGFSIITILNINTLKKDLLSQSSLIARLVGEYSQYALIYEDVKVAKENLENLKAVPNVITAELYDSSGIFFASYRNKLSKYTELIIAKSKFEEINDEFYIYEPIFNADKVLIGNILLIVSQRELNKSVTDYILLMIGIILFVAVLITLLARSFQKIISRPILRLAAVTKEITDTNDYSIRIYNKSNDEINFLAEGINKMLEEIVRNQIAMLTVQDELRDSQEQFFTFMEMLPAAAYIKNQDSSFYYVNKFLTEKFNANNWLYQKNTSLLPSDKKQLSANYDKEALLENQHFEEFIYDSSNELRYFETWKFPLFRKEKPTLIGGIAIDITTRKFAEKQLNYYVQELERNNKELEEFNYVASHDLREPLRTITSYCDLLAEDLGPENNPMVKEDIRFITDATTRMNILIQDLLQLSRAGRIEFDIKPVDLNKMMVLVLQDLELKINETNSTIKVENLPVVLGDSIQLGRVFQNLLTNAIKFRSKKDPFISIEAVEKNNYFEIIVSDNGIGIEKQYQQQIFSAFKRLHSREKYDGTGIGLAICKKIIERHNGLIQVESEPGKGSKFKIQLKKAES